MDFYHWNRDSIRKEFGGILGACKKIGLHLHTVHPLRKHLGGAIEPGKHVTPDIDWLKQAAETRFGDCKISICQAESILGLLRSAEFVRLVDDLWLTGEKPSSNSGIDPLEALRKKQQSLDESPTYSEDTETSKGNEDTETHNYLGAMAILIYSSWKSLEYLTELFSLWVDIARNHSGVVLEDHKVQIQVLSCSRALLNAQVTWNTLMGCPWTVAWALHLLCSYTTPSHPQVDAEDVNETDDGYATDLETTRPAKFARVFYELDHFPIRRLLEECFRLDAVIRRQWEAQEEFVPSGGNRARKVDISLASNRGPVRVEQSDLMQNIRNYWKTQAASNPDDEVREAFDILLQLPASSEQNLGMRLGIPKAHCECIVVQDWVSKRNRALPAIGASRPVCGTCEYFLGAVFQHVYKQVPCSHLMKRMVPGTGNAFRLCTVPEQSPILVKQAVAERLLGELSRQLTSNRVWKCLRKKLEGARGSGVPDQNRGDPSDDSDSWEPLGPLPKVDEDAESPVHVPVGGWPMSQVEESFQLED
ncbi:hypothetical protein Daus18300_014511 [Diaporthe australafricana]|uniref:Uncharacterized protein n=1 Tax=Diaporthe australafricana TaxID=127596 RepID=A0ABR3VUW2_9PEZI